MRKKLLSLLLAALLIAGLLPAAAFAADGDAAPTAALPDGTSLTVTDTEITTGDGFPVYKTTVPQGTASVTVSWAQEAENSYIGCGCGGWYDNAIKESYTVPLSNTTHDFTNEEQCVVDDGVLTSGDIAKIKTDAGNKLIVLTLERGERLILLCVEIDGSVTVNSAPTLASGVALYTVVAPDGETYTADVTKFFVDEDAGDTLTYYVSVNGGEFTQLENPETYTYAYGEGFVRARLEFKANDGSADSLSNPTVILNDPDYPVVVGANSRAVSTETGKAVQLNIGNLIKHPKSQTIYFFVSIDGGEYKRITLSSNNYTYAPTKAGKHTLRFKAATSTGKESDVYTWTVTATGADIENHAPVVKNPTEGPGQLGSGVNVTYWKPDLASIFQDPDGDALTYAYSTDDGDFKEYYSSVGIHADYLTPDGSHTVTIRATDPYGEYAEFTVTIEKTTNHRPTKKADAPDEISVFVPVGLTYKVDANLYYADVDAKDQGNLRFKSARYGSAGKYTATTVGDTKTETAYGNDTSNANASSGIKITYTAIAVDKEESLEAGAAYTLNVADLGLAGNVKVRVNAGAEQAVDADVFTYTVPEDAGEYILHFYSDKTATAEENYVVKLTLEAAPVDRTPVVTIGGKEYRAVLTDAKGDVENFWGEEVDIYKVVVPADFETLTVSAAFEGSAFCNCEVQGVKMPIRISKHDCPYLEGFVTDASQIIDAKHQYIYVTISGYDGYGAGLIIQLGEDSETPFTPGIGNGTASGTTENGVTTFPAGTGSATPTVTVTAPANGWTAGENTFTVACEKACVVMVKSGETYTKLTAANADGVHSFTATLADGSEIIVRLKGDVNGDGVVNNTDTIQACAASLGKATLTEINAACAKVTDKTAVTNTDVIQIGAVALGKAAFQW